MKLLVEKGGRKLLINEALMKDEMNTDLGIIKKEDVINTPIGGKVVTHTGTEFRVLQPSFYDYFEALERGPQIITLKDCGLISAYTGLCSGMRVLDAGVGSGALTAYLANIIKPKGKVFAYEVREDFLKLGKRNIERFGLTDSVEFRNKSVYEGIDEVNLDLVTLDLPEPWRALPHVEKALKPGGYLVCYLPTITQVVALSEGLKKTSIAQLRVAEVLERAWRIEGQVIRPESLMLGHTGFLVFCRKQ